MRGSGATRRRTSRCARSSTSSATSSLTPSCKARRPGPGKRFRVQTPLLKPLPPTGKTLLSRCVPRWVGVVRAEGCYARTREGCRRETWGVTCVRLRHVSGLLLLLCTFKGMLSVCLLRVLGSSGVGSTDFDSIGSIASPCRCAGPRLDAPFAASLWMTARVFSRYQRRCEGVQLTAFFWSAPLSVLWDGVPSLRVWAMHF